MDELDGVPCKLLGYKISTRAQICLSCCITAALELVVYMLVTAADIAVVIQHFRDSNPRYATLTLGFLILPAVGCFCSIVVSPWQWPESDDDERPHCGKEQIFFFLRQLYNMLCFPIAAIYRLSRRLFWSIEAMFHARDSYERHHATAKAAETSPFELYHFLQAFLQAAPQIILQFYIILREDVFRNYETSVVQAISIVSSLITMAITIDTYQRFESQKIVGRNYPWATQHQVKCRKNVFMRTKSMLEDRLPENSYFELPESEHIMKRFQSTDTNGRLYTDSDDDDCEVILPALPSSPMDAPKSMHLGDYNLDIDNDLSSDDEDNVTKRYSRFASRHWRPNIPLDGASTSNMPATFRPRSSDLNIILEDNASAEILDFSPNHAAPPPPPPYSPQFLLNRISTFKDMMFLNAEIYIKENVPRLPENLFNHDNSDKKQQNHNQRRATRQESHISRGGGDGTAPTSPSTGVDEPDFAMPTRKKMLEGIEQEDFVAKAVAFMAWILFLFQRMVALSAFFFFYPWECTLLCIGHYVAMVLFLFVETRFHEKIERTVFYLFLAYIYVFCILEFKIKFNKPRYWFVGYVTCVLIQNLSITLIWYYRQEFESWWFEYLFAAVLLSLCYSIMCLLVYFFLLKPADKVLFENEDGK